MEENSFQQPLIPVFSALSTFPMAVQSAEKLIYRRHMNLRWEPLKCRNILLEVQRACSGQIRRSARSICNILREACAIQRYEAHFIYSLTEHDETDPSLDFAKDCGYIIIEQHRLLNELNREVGMLDSMINNPEQFLLKP